MARKGISVNGALVGGLAGWVAEVAIQEITGHHLTTGLLELLGAAAGLWRLDQRLTGTLKETLARAQEGPENNYRQVKQRIEELTRDLPELREILGNLVDAGIAARRPEMLGLNLLVRLTRQVLAGPVADSGVLPAGYYRHLALAALEEEDFPGALRFLKWVGDPLLTQILVFRLRLLAEGHRRQRQGLQELLQSSLPAATAAKCRDLLVQEDRALGLLAAYETQALAGLAKNRS